LGLDPAREASEDGRVSMHALLGGPLMFTRDAVLVQLVRSVDRIPTALPPARRPRGRPLVYSDWLFLKALVIMIVRRLHKVHELLSERGASPLVAPSSGGCATCPRLYPKGSDVWEGIRWRCSGRKRTRGERWRSTAPCSGLKAECGTKRTYRHELYSSHSYYTGDAVVRVKRTAAIRTLELSSRALY
jgi:hypothetical protein